MEDREEFCFLQLGIQLGLLSFSLQSEEEQKDLENLCLLFDL